jgi:hypothetical protein
VTFSFILEPLFQTIFLLQNLVRNVSLGIHQKIVLQKDNPLIRAVTSQHTTLVSGFSFLGTLNPSPVCPPKPAIGLGSEAIGHIPKSEPKPMQYPFLLPSGRV